MESPLLEDGNDLRNPSESFQWQGQAALILWIGLTENFNRKPMGFYHQIDRAFRLKFSHNPILWLMFFLRDWNISAAVLHCQAATPSKTNWPTDQLKDFYPWHYASVELIPWW